MFLRKLHNSKDPEILDDKGSDCRFDSFGLSMLASCISHSCRKRFGVSIFMLNNVTSLFLAWGPTRS